MSDSLIAGGYGSPATDWSGELTALESRADIDSLEDLHTRRRQLLPEYGALRALHGSNGKWDAKRKQMLEAIKVRVRMDARKREEKVTEAYIDALAHADESYDKMITESIVAATRYFELECEMSEIEERIRSRELAILAYNAEARLSR